MIDTEAIFQSRVEAILAGQGFPGFDPDSQGTPLDPTQVPSDLAAEFIRLRAATLEAFARLTEGDLDRRGTHAELGPVTLNELIHEWAAHDLMHTVQAERAMMQPLIHSCGPWLKYFWDHAVAEPAGAMP